MYISICISVCVYIGYICIWGTVELGTTVPRQVQVKSLKIWLSYSCNIC